MKKIFLLTLIISFLLSPPKTRGYETQRQVKISAEIDGIRVQRIFGYTSPGSVVQITGQRVFGWTSSDREGYFMFEDFLISPEAKELCLTSLDDDRRATFPVCFTPPNDMTYEIGPVLLPPTLSLSEKIIWERGNIFASGKSIPDSEVAVSFFSSKNRTLLGSVSSKIASFILPQAEASELPVLSVMTDSKGNFSFSVPTSKASKYRLFTSSNYLGFKSLKSQTLTYKIHTIIQYFFFVILPRIILWLVVISMISYSVYWELRHGKVRKSLGWFTENVLIPGRTKSYLKLQRLFYNLRDYRRSRQK